MKIGNIKSKKTTYKKIKNVVIATALILSSILCNKTVARAEEATTPSGIPLSQLETTIDDYMKDYIGKTSQGAAIVYIHDGQIYFSKGYGYANVENNIEVMPEETVFEYASISKNFTFTALMQLKEQGKIDLNADIAAYLPEDFMQKLHTNLKFDKTIRVIDLMNHRAGFEDKYFNTDVTKEMELSKTLEEALIAAMPKQVYEPDTVTSYSNYSAALAGYIVECVTGEKLYDYLQDHLFEPLDMISTTANPRYDNIESIVDNKAIGYGDGITDNGWCYVNTYPDGSLNGTATDLAKFAMSFMEEDCSLFESSETVKELFTTSYSVSENITGCAHGFWEYQGAGLFYQHDGSQRGFSSLYTFSPASKTGLVILTNSGGEIYITYGLCQLILGDNSELQVSAGNGLPSAYELDDMEFLSARRNYSDITSIFSYLEGNEKVKVVDDTKIQMNGLTYVETAPYFYQLTEDKDSLLARSIYSSVYFMTNDYGDVTGLSFGGTAGSDYLKCQFPYTNISFLLQVVLFFITLVTFIFTPIILLLRYLRNKKKDRRPTLSEKRYYSFIHRISVTGLLMVINVIILVLNLLSYEEFGPTFGINLQIGITYAFSILFVLFFLARIRYVIQNKERLLYKKRHALLIVAFCYMVIFLGMWNFYSFM